LSKERKPRLAQRLQTDRGLYRALQRWGYYLLALMAWVTVVLAVSALGVLVCSRLTWYETDPLYHLLLWVRDYYFFFCIAVVLLGWVVISWHFISRPVRQLDALIGASAQLTRPTEEPIRLPASMKSVEDQLNLAREEALRAQRAAREAEQRKNDLVVYLAHDLKTPLTSIISYAELLEQEHLEPPAGEYVTILSQKAQRLKGMVQDVFEVSKAASGQLPVSLKRLDLARLLRQTLADMDQPIQESGLQLRTQLPDHSVLIQGDSDRLYRVFQNLLGNALKYSLAGSRVYLTLTVEEGQAVAALRNTSAAELRPGLDYTQRFVRGDESRTDGGSGLGLSIASSFVQACGGQFQVETQADLFTALVSFPLDASPSDPR